MLADLDTTWTDVTLTIPGFSTKALVTVGGVYVDGEAALYSRVNGQSGTTGLYVLYTGVGTSHPRNSVTVITDSSQKIEIVHSTSNGNKARVDTNGWYLPTGM